MKLILSALIALNLGLYELPPVVYRSGVEGAKQAAFDTEEYLVRARKAAEDAYVKGDISTEVWEEYDFLDKSATHYQHLFVMSVLFYEEAPVEDPYGRLVTKSSMEMIKRLTLIKRLIASEGIIVPAPMGKLVVSACSL
ncbi:MAG: hypothetical protein ACE5IC_08140 [Candidatus Brocadiales bacterium]